MDRKFDGDVVTDHEHVRIIIDRAQTFTGINDKSLQQTMLKDRPLRITN